MAGAGRHPHQGRRLRAGQSQRHRDPLLLPRREVAPQLRGQPLLLAGVHRDQPQRRAQLGQVVRGRGHHQQRSVAAQHPRELRPVAGREHVEQQPRRARGQRQPAPDVAAHRARARMGAGGAPQRVAGHVHGQAVRLRHRVQHRGQVVAGARADVDHQAPAPPPDGVLGQRRGQRGVVPGGEELAAGPHHLPVVPGTGRPSHDQVDVPLPGRVEGVPPRAGQRTARRRQAAPAVRAGQRLHHGAGDPQPLPVVHDRPGYPRARPAPAARPFTPGAPAAPPGSGPAARPGVRR